MFARGVDKRPTFNDEQDYRAFLRALHRISLETNTVILAFCLMPNHFHLALKVSTVPLGRVMLRLLTSYVKTFNNRHARTGHLFEARHKAILCLTDRYLLRLIRYIQMNPVRANLVQNAADWPWSSRSPEGLPNLDDKAFDPWSAEIEPPALIRTIGPPAKPIAEIGAMIAGSAGVGPGSLQSAAKCRPIVAAKARFAVECVKQGHSIRAIADWLGCQSQVVTYYLRKNSTNLYA